MHVPTLKNIPLAEFKKGDRALIHIGENKGFWLAIIDKVTPGRWKIRNLVAPSPVALMGWITSLNNHIVRNNYFCMLLFAQYSGPEV